MPKVSIFSKSFYDIAISFLMEKLIWKDLRGTVEKSVSVVEKEPPIY